MMSGYHHNRLRLALIAIRMRARGSPDDMGADVARIVDDALAGDAVPAPREAHQFDPVRVDGAKGFEVEVRSIGTADKPPHKAK